MKSILILEDDESQARELERIISSNIPNCRLSICGSEQDARDKAASQDYHLLIIDIVLENGSGLSFAKWIRTIPKYQLTWIIFITGHDVYALDAIRNVHCYDYILKPYREGDIVSAINRIIKMKVEKDNNSNYLSIESKGISFRIKLNEILFIEINNKNMDIHTLNKVYSVKRYPLTKIKDQLPKNLFLQCHRSFIVNSEKISAVESRSRDTYIMMLSHDKPIPVGIRYKELFTFDNALN